MIEQTQKKKRKFFGFFSFFFSFEIISWEVFAMIKPTGLSGQKSSKNSLIVFIMEFRQAKEINADKVRHDIKMFWKQEYDEICSANNTIMISLPLSLSHHKKISCLGKYYWWYNNIFPRVAFEFKIFLHRGWNSHMRGVNNLIHLTFSWEVSPQNLSRSHRTSRYRHCRTLRCKSLQARNNRRLLS